MVFPTAPLMIVALIGSFAVGIPASIALKNDWKSTGLDNNTTKLLLGLMIFGCVLVLLASLHIIGPKEA
jgi:hypothetical protein